MTRFSTLLALALLPAAAALAQVAPPPAERPQWHHLDPAADHVMGISTERAYALLRQLGRRPVGPPLVVAVIDGGIDTAHVDLRRVLWHNPGEVPGNGRDDEHDGYVDDVYGWNFMGGPNGQQVYDAAKEETRLVARLGPRYAGKQAADVPASQQAEFRLYQQADKEYRFRKAELEDNYSFLSQLLQRQEARTAALKLALHRPVLDSALLHHPPTADTALVRESRFFYREMLHHGLQPNTDSLSSGLRQVVARCKQRLACAYNPAYNPQALVGDHPADLTERFYGNNNLSTRLGYPGTDHGTHCAGLLGADRANHHGVRGVADHVRLLSVRCIPDGDERDKDVANAIRYAVDHGARIISMSFGKYLSPDKAVVDEAIRYADTKGVLLVHVAGNDHLNVDSTAMYPSSRYLDGRRIPNLLTVGASDQHNDEHLPAKFSNYGPQSVDVFAPGVNLVSTTPGNTYLARSGTSMATPVVAGMAAVLKAYFPQLTPADLKRLIMASAAPVHTKVRRPGSQELVDFATLSRAGGVVNLYEAVRLAALEPVVKPIKR